MKLSLHRVDETTFEHLLKNINTRQRLVDRDAELVNAERQQATAHEMDLISERMAAWTPKDDLSSVRQSLASMDNMTKARTLKLIRLMKNMSNEPSREVNKKINDLHDGLGESDRVEILEWSPWHNIRKDRLHESGTWLLEHSVFQTWENANLSSILWLHGTPGSGKSKLT